MFLLLMALLRYICYTKTANIILTVSNIKKCVADYYNLSVQQINSKARTANIIVARHIAMYLIRYTLDTPLKKIGEVFSGKDHTTVMSGISKVEKI